jgi:16S rRNA (adenine1518-N6/adenine1519-N6)-dimethyltransferase
MKQHHTQKSFSPKKFLGQNFLVDPHVQNKMMDAFQLDPLETVLEIGPGKGALTKRIYPHVKKVIAVETDRLLVEELRQVFKNTNVEIIHEDFLKFDLGKLPGPVKVIGNLPYYITTPIIEKIFEYPGLCQRFFMTVQWEFGQRLKAAPNTKAYGSFTCFVQYHADVHMYFKIKNTAFSPRPKVDSCFLELKFHDANLSPGMDKERLFQVIRQAFQQRRKTIENSLSKLFNKELLRQAFQTAGFSGQLRAENLTLKDYIKLTQALILQGRS